MYFFFQAEDGIRDLVRSRGLGDVYKRQDGVGAGRYLAVHALAQLKDARAQERVLSAAKDQNLSLIHI